MKKALPEKPNREVILLKSMDEVMHESMIPYAEHVILERAIPRVEDGLKPVQRRILYTMMELSLTPDKPHRKSARIVGDCLGKYHPHGDSSVYEAMVHLAQPFAMSLPLVDGHGNFGSVDGDKAAAMRYTEARMTEAAMQMLRDIDSDTVEYTNNFDDTLKEPVLLPGRYPNLLINGSSGIAVGLATNIPPHNPGEVIDAVIARLNDPAVSLDDIMKLLPAPDFPTGGYLLDSPEIRAAYETGRGKLTVRAKTEIETLKNGKSRIIITEIPYGINKAAMLLEILQLTEQKKALFAGITDIRDESDRTGMRAVIEIKKDADPEKIRRALFRYSDLQITFGANFTAIAEGKPRQLGLLELIDYYIGHQKNVLTRRTRYQLEAAEKRCHIFEGLMVVVDRVDEVIRLIRASKNPKAARLALMDAYSLSETQAQAILDLKLQKLTNLELLDIEKEYERLKKEIRNLKEILASEKKLSALLEKELKELRALFPVARRTVILREERQDDDAEKEEDIPESAVVSLCEGLKVRRLQEKYFTGNELTADGPLFSFRTDTSKRLRLFTNLGSVLHVAVRDIPEIRPGGKSFNLASLLPFDKDEKILYADTEPEEGSYIFFTAKGQVKCTPKKEYALKVKKSSALTLKDGDSLIGVGTRTENDVLLITAKGMSLRFGAEELVETGRVSAGVRGIKLNEDDRVFFGGQIDDEGEMLLLTDRGFTKRCFLFDYEPQNRAGKGVRTFDMKKNGTNGRELILAAPVTVPATVSVTRRQSGQSTLLSEEVPIERLSGKGLALIPVLLDDDIVSAFITTE